MLIAGLSGCKPFSWETDVENIHGPGTPGTPRIVHFFLEFQFKIVVYTQINKTMKQLMIERETYKSWWTRFRQAELRMDHRQNKVLARRDFHPNKVHVKVWSLFCAILGRVSHLRDVTIWGVNFPCHFQHFQLHLYFYFFLDFIWCQQRDFE